MANILFSIFLILISTFLAGCDGKFQTVSLSSKMPQAKCSTSVGIKNCVSESVSPTANLVIGYTEGLIKDSAGNLQVKGWTCIKGDLESIAVHVYANGPYPSGQFITADTANKSSEPAVGEACGTSGRAYRFLVPISSALQSQFSGAPLYVHAINNYSNPVLPSISKIKIPTSPISAPTSNLVKGYTEGLIKDSMGNLQLKGWTCIKGDLRSIAVHVYANGPSPSGQLITTDTANKSSEPAVGEACGTSGRAYRFSIPISSELQSQFSGAPLYVHAINNYSNPVLPSINEVRIPEAPVAIGPGPTVETWKVLEISLTSSLNYTNPFTDVAVNATFTGPGGIKISRPAFWDGGHVWKIRFAPTVPGQWNYVTTATQADFGLQGKSGTLNAVPYSGSQPIYRNGFLKSSGSHYLAYRNGTPFFWMGHDFTMIDSARLNKTNKFNWNPVPAHADSQLYGMIENAALKQFNVLNFAFFAKWNQKNGNQIADDLNVTKFQTLYDPAMEFAASHGFVVMLALGYREEMNMGVEANKRYARYLVARYGAYPVVWTVTEMDHPDYASQAPLWGEVFSYASSLDAYRHPMGPWYRQTALSETPTLYLNQPWVSLIIHQCGHQLAPGNNSLGGNQLSRLYQFYYDNFPHIPMVEAGGCNYEQIYAGVDDYVARRSAWRAIQAGSSGFGYGAEGIWNMNWTQDRPTMNYGSQNLSWSVGIDLPGSWSMAYLKYFYSEIPWHTMKPRNGKHSVVTWSNDGGLTDMQKPLVRGDEGLRNVLIYIPKEFSSPGDSGGIVGLGGGSYVTKWYNPRNGATIIINKSMVPGAYGTWTIPKKPDGMDWVLQMTAQ